jgi:AmmeMemoRadiSam system protein B
MKLRNLVFILACILVLASCSKKTEEAAGVNTLGTAGYQYFKDTEMWKNIFNHTQAFVVPKNLTPTSIMIPHHDIAIGNQNSFYKALSPLVKPSVVVIISPDHFERGKNIITMPQNTVFSSPEGDHVLDKEIIKKISEDKELSSYVSLQDDLWFEEHGIFSHTPFIKHYFPDARVVPVVLKMLSKDDEFEKYKALGKVLAKILPEDSLVIASVDCSHYQIPSVTAFHDYVIVDTLMRMENPRYAEIDSPESITALLSYNKALGAVNPVLLHQSSTYDFIPQEFVESTSHLYISFYKDSSDLKDSLNTFYDDVKNTKQRAKKINNEKRAQTLFFAGSGKTGAGIRKTWEWDRYNTSKDPAENLLKPLAGKEARFLYGFDALIFDPMPGTVYERTLHGTKLTVKTISQDDYDSFYKEETKPYAGPILKIKQMPEVKVLEVVLTGSKTIAPRDQIKELLKNFDVIVFRDDEGKKDAMLYCNKSNLEEIEEVNLGICHGQAAIKGNVAFINFDGEDINLCTLPYQSDDGIIPAIHQFIPDDENAAPVVELAPGDREN